jgi:hypothetical protein
MRREIPLILTIVFGWFMVAEFFTPIRWIGQVSGELQQWIIIVAAAAVVLGVANVGRIHFRKVSRKEKGWPYSVPLLAGLVGMGATGLIFGIREGSVFDFFYLNAYVPMQGTMFALLAFFIASAAFRAFRIRSVEAGLLAIAAVIVMIGRVPVGTAISDAFRSVVGDPGFGLAETAEWIMDFPNLAAKRAILIGAALGAISTGLKILLGFERNLLGSE